MSWKIGVDTRLLCPWDPPGKNTGVGCHFLLQGIFLTQGSHFRQILYHLSHQGSDEMDGDIITDISNTGGDRSLEKKIINLMCLWKM